MNTTEQRYFDIALTAKQKKLAKRLAKLPEAHDRLNDPEMRYLDDTQPQAAHIVMLYVDALNDDKES